MLCKSDPDIGVLRMCTFLAWRGTPTDKGGRDLLHNGTCIYVSVRTGILGTCTAGQISFQSVEFSCVSVGNRSFDQHTNMECHICGVEKLWNEYPPENVNKACRHAILACLRCTVKYVKDHSMCPHKACENAANIEDQQLKWFQAILDTMFKEYHPTDTPLLEASTGGADKLYVTVLTGESMEISYSPNMAIQVVKSRIQQVLKHETNRQKLLYKDSELEVYKENGILAKLSDYGVPANATLHLVVLLYAIPEGFDHVVFDLYWGYPISGRDYLDVSCLIYEGLDFRAVCDFRGTNRGHGNFVRHSGDVMDDANRKGHHTINVQLKQIPSTVSHLFFTLSAWSSPDISRYPNPSLRFFEASKPGTDLCKTTFTHARYSQAVVMCSLSRGSHGGWEILESGKLSAGNAKAYGPLQTTIKGLVQQGF